MRHRGRGRPRCQGLQLDQRSVPSQPQLVGKVLPELTVLILPPIGHGRLRHRVPRPRRPLVIRDRLALRNNGSRATLKYSVKSLTPFGGF